MLVRVVIHFHLLYSVLYSHPLYTYSIHIPAGVAISPARCWASLGRPVLKERDYVYTLQPFIETEESSVCFQDFFFSSLHRKVHCDIPVRIEMILNWWTFQQAARMEVRTPSCAICSLRAEHTIDLWLLPRVAQTESRRLFRYIALTRSYSLQKLTPPLSIYQASADLL
jgi:hypothetical protein